MRTRDPLRTPALALFCLVSSACAAIHRPPATRESLMEDAGRYRVAERAKVDTVIGRLARRVAMRGDRTLDVLVLSGGGQNGAYGVGFLRGWKSRTEAPLPRFDLVTGISTGALMAPFAFVGTEPALDTIAAIYRRAADRIAPTVDWFFWLRRTGGVVNTKRYRENIASIMSAQLRDQMRPQFDSLRQLVFATVDYDLAIGRTWDFAQELGNDDAGLARIHTLLLAATAIPGIFPPVIIDGHVSGDGGITGNFLPLFDLDDYRRLADRLRATNVGGAAEPVTLRVWVIGNFWTHARPNVINPASRKGISARSSEILFFGHQPLELQRLTELARAVSADVPGIKMEVKISVIPQELALAPGADKLFQREFMARLEQVGYDRARGAAPWDSVTSVFERPR